MSYFAAPDLRPFAPDRFPVWIFHGANFGDSDWLDAQMSLVDYGHRSVPNVFLTAPLQTTNAKTGTGPWNAAHFASAQYDKLVAQYIAAVDLTTSPSLRLLGGFYALWRIGGAIAPPIPRNL